LAMFSCCDGNYHVGAEWRIDEYLSHWLAQKPGN